MAIFREPFERFKARLKSSQKQKSIWKVTRWSVHDYERFRSLVDNIREIIDALEGITSALGMLERQQTMLANEIESLSDTQSLELLQEVGSSRHAPEVLQTVSETASLRLTAITSSSRSYHTALTEQTRGSSSGQRALPIRSLRSVEHSSRLGGIPDEGVSGAKVIPSQNKMPTQDARQEQSAFDERYDIPQHQRWIAELLRRHQPKSQTLADPKGDSEYGKALRTIKQADEDAYCASSAKLMSQAHEGQTLARQVFIELRNVRRASVPFISAATVDDDISQLIASIEGPPGTPYEGGVFWITVKLSEGQPPVLRFQTRIYHPNIDHSGTICADYASWWRETHLMNERQRGRQLPWFSERITNHYSIGALLVALCGLLASPNVDDPLVPEIAEKYVTDFEAYCQAAKLCTQRYAKCGRPDTSELKFPANGPELRGGKDSYEPPEFTSKTVSESLINPWKVASKENEDEECAIGECPNLSKPSDESENDRDPPLYWRMSPSCRQYKYIFEPEIELEEHFDVRALELSRDICQSLGLSETVYIYLQKNSFSRSYMSN